MNKLLLSCLKATELMEKKFHVKLSFTERLQLKAHKLICKACAEYEEHTLFIDKVLSSPPKNSVQSNKDLEKFKGDIKKKIQDVEM